VGHNNYTLLSDDIAVKEVVSSPVSVLSGLPDGGIHICISTISVELSKELESLHAGKRQVFVAAPIFGRPDAAKNRKIRIAAGGSEKGYQKVEKILNDSSQRVYYIGAPAYLANVVKLATNMMLAASLEAMAESFTLASAFGVDPELFTK
jgi:3-hydroxyisobutyrate dehydrogenase-like beta-hydroxyacid dehydrogenase